MRLKGDIATVEKLEQLVKARAKCEVIHDGGSGSHSMLGNGDRSLAYSKTIIVHKNGIHTALKLDFDYRYRYGIIDIKDSKVWVIAGIAPELAPEVAQFIPYRSHGRRRGEFLKAMDRVLDK